MYEIGSSWKTNDVLLAAVDAVAGAGLVVSWQMDAIVGSILPNRHDKIRHLLGASSYWRGQ